MPPAGGPPDYAGQPPLCSGPDSCPATAVALHAEMGQGVSVQGSLVNKNRKRKESTTLLNAAQPLEHNFATSILQLPIPSLLLLPQINESQCAVTSNKEKE